MISMEELYLFYSFAINDTVFLTIVFVSFINLRLIRRYWLSMVGVQTQQRQVKWWVSSKIKPDSIQL